MHRWRNALNLLSINHSVHPSEPAAPNHSEFLEINSAVRLRIIHVKAKVTESQVAEENKENVTKRNRKSRNSLYEEYWFTRCNKPVRHQRCSCSFRRSQRYSATISSQNIGSSKDISVNTAHNNIAKDSRVPSIEVFVENIIEDCLIEAIREYVAKSYHLSNNGYHNIGFIDTEDCLGVGIKTNIKHEIARNQLEDASIKDKVNNNQSITTAELRSRKNDNFKSDVQVTIKKECPHSAPNNKTRPLVILFHGIGTSADIWWSVINCLSSNGYEVVAPDMLGHGYSSVPNQASAYKFKSLLKHAIAVFEHYVESSDFRKTIIIAHSFGCSIATAVCRHKVQQVSQLILISGGGPTPLAPPVQSEVPLVRCLQTIFKPLLFCGVKRTLLYSSRGKYFENCDPSNTVVPSHVLHYIIKGQHWPEGDAAFHRKILVPTLLVHGLQDKQITLVQECEMERTIPRSFLELIPNCGHLPMLETPDQLNHMIACFIDWWSR